MTDELTSVYDVVCVGKYYRKFFTQLVNRREPNGQSQLSSYADVPIGASVGTGAAAAAMLPIARQSVRVFIIGEDAPHVFYSIISGHAEVEDVRRIRSSKQKVHYMGVFKENPASRTSLEYQDEYELMRMVCHGPNASYRVFHKGEPLRRPGNHEYHPGSGLKVPDECKTAILREFFRDGLDLYQSMELMLPDNGDENQMGLPPSDVDLERPFIALIMYYVGLQPNKGVVPAFDYYKSDATRIMVWRQYKRVFDEFCTNNPDFLTPSKPTAKESRNRS